jgi:HrpA-like RNA helicase
VHVHNHLSFFLLITQELLALFPSIKLVLMSATVSADAYVKYFALGGTKPLYVGARCFELTTRYIEDIADKGVLTKLSPPVSKALSKLKVLVLISACWFIASHFIF